MSNIRYALRSLLQARWFTAGAVLTFALGIGVNVAVFSAVDRVLFRPLPYARPHDLYVMREFAKGSDKGAGTLPAAYLVEMRRRHHGVVDASVTGFSESFTVSREPVDEPSILLTTASFNTLAVFGVRPFVGRDFTIEDARAHRRCVLISAALWRARFGSASDVIGRQLWQGGKPVEIIGILPEDFIPASSFLNPSSDGLTLDDETMEVAGPRDRAYAPTVRLAPGVGQVAAQAELNALVDTVKQTLPAPRPGQLPTELRLIPLEEVLFGQYATYVWLVTCAASLVLLVACGNLASLLLVRCRSREHISAMQLALGATPGRLLRAALTEALLLSAAGALVAVVVMAWTSTSLARLLPPIFSRYAASMGEPRVMGFALLIAVAGAMVAGLLPAWRLSRVDVMRVLQRSGASARGRRLRGGRGLLAIEAALSVVLVVAATVTARSLVGLERTDFGFEPTNLYRLTVMYPALTDANARFDRYARTLEVIRTIPGVTSAAAANDIFLSGSTGWGPFGKGYERMGRRSSVTGDYFEVLGMRPVAGRTISTADVASRAPVAVFSVRAQQVLWPGTRPAEAVGRFLPFADETLRQVVGVVADVRSGYLAELVPAIYVPIDADSMRWMDFVARVEPGKTVAVTDLRQCVRYQIAQPSTVVVGQVTTSLGLGLRDQTFRAVLFGSFGVVALLLAALGLYAVGTFEVALRRVEMGIRITLGATAGDVQRLVLREALTPVALGVCAGLGVSYWAARFVQAFLYHVDARDPATYLLVAAVFIGTAGMAAWLPARRASRLDPATVLRAQ